MQNLRGSSSTIDSKNKIQINEEDAVREILLALLPTTTSQAISISHNYPWTWSKTHEFSSKLYNNSYIHELFNKCNSIKVCLNHLSSFSHAHSQYQFAPVPSAPLVCVASLFANNLIKAIEQAVHNVRTMDNLNENVTKWQSETSKVYSFFLELIKDGDSLSYHAVENTWATFFMNEITYCDMGMELPIHFELKKLLLKLLPSYMDLLSKEGTNINRNEKDVILTVPQRDSRMSRNGADSDMKIVYFNNFWTDSLIKVFKKAFSYRRRIHTANEKHLSETKSWSHFIQFRLDALTEDQKIQLKPDKTATLLEETCGEYCNQFTSLILNELHVSSKLKTRLEEIRLIYSMEIFAETVSDFTSVDNLESPRASKVVKLQKALESCRMPSPNSYQYYKIQWIDETDTFRVVPQYSWPSKIILNPDFFTALNRCLHILGKMCYLMNCCMFVTIHVRLTAELYNDPSVVRQARTLIQIVTQYVHDLYVAAMHFFKSKIDQAIDEILNAKDLESIESSVERWTKTMTDTFTDRFFEVGIMGLTDLVTSLANLSMNPVVSSVIVLSLRRKLGRCAKLLEPSLTVEEIVSGNSLECYMYKNTQHILTAIDQLKSVN